MAQPRPPVKTMKMATLIWDLTESNFFTFIIPNSIFGVLGASAASLLTVNGCPTTAEILWRSPIIIAFNWINILTFDLANQTSPGSVQEDLLNKPWRPIPSGKITLHQARRALLASVPIALAANGLLGLWTEGLCIQVLNWMYNDLGGGDAITRDLLISIAYGLSHTCSLRLAVGVDNDMSHQGLLWTATLSGVILTTMQVQDLKDQEGDRTRGRQTVVLVFGDTFSRGSIAFFVCCWSIICPCIWGLNMWAYVITLAPGITVAGRAWFKRTPKEDHSTWVWWCLWTVVLYLTPVLSLQGWGALI
ncbi:hypothetical protein KJ359_004539 [Pestalotiopsis sp. 9143b]|nr:hypothetical protein KJ359_004539 [Pestalotiopsis sp. 9143b]